MARSSLSVLLLLTAIASGCITDLDCSLNGVCIPITASCYCDSPWTGPACGVLSVLPVPDTPVYGHAAGPGKPALSSWGGVPLLLDGTYHLFVAEIVNGCGMHDWPTNSRCVHATSQTLTGPYALTDEALPVFCHNPMVVRDPASATLYMFHIGTGNGSSTTVNCSDTAVPVNGGGSGGALSGSAAGGFLHSAPAPAGPWTPVPPARSPPACNNPAPLRLANGTWMLLCKANPSVLYSAPSVLGPWGRVTELTSIDHRGHYEDAFMWEDARRGLHIIFHLYNYTAAPEPPATCKGDLVSAHAFADVDGTAWRFASEDPYVNTYTTASGAEVVAATRERPKFFFNSGGVPIALFNGVSALATCPGLGLACVNCKYTNSSYTIVQPLAAA